jgi:hypothetical protein
MRKTTGLMVALALLAVGGTAHATAYVIHMQGRGWASWNTMYQVQASAEGWTNDFITYDGNSALTNSTSTTNINNKLIADCEGSNVCRILCYSAGCLRMQKAVSDLRASGHNLAGLAWAEATASAAGGTNLAVLSTKGGTSLIAKLIGQQEKIDTSLTPTAARAAYTSDFNRTIYHEAGNQDMCKGFLFFKICGNAHIGGGGHGDGVVPFDSAFGCNSTNGSPDCNCTKYAYHSFENRVTGVNCTGQQFDHFGMANSGCQILTAVLAGSGQAPLVSWSDSTSNPECNASGTDNQCDDQFNSTSQNWSKKTDLSSIATSVATKASNTTLYTDSRYITGPNTSYDDTGSGQYWRWSCGGKCGGNNTAGGVTRCACDSGCVARGNCCDDYSTSVCTGRGLNSTDCGNNTARCDTVNAQ